MEFLATYVVGILGIIFFNLGTAWNACVIEAPPDPFYKTIEKFLKAVYVYTCIMYICI